MRWFLGLLLVIALVSGALYAMGRFLLPNTLEVTRTISIERPRAAVLAMSNDLRIAREWSPFYAMDPEAEFSFSGESAGEGQTMRWASDVRQVGEGRISIVSSTENEAVESILELGDRATLNSAFELRPVQGGALVEWTVSAECAVGWINVPCRYMNLILRGRIQSNLDAGLARLKTLAEQLPNVNFENLRPSFSAVESQNFVFSVVETPAGDFAEIQRAEDLALEQVRSFMTQYNLNQAGPLVRVVTDQTADRMSFRVGYPYTGPTPLTVVGVQLGQTPSGRAMHVLVEGSRNQVQAAYTQMHAYLQAHRIPLREDGLPWVIVHAAGAPDGSTPARLEIFMPLQ